MENWVTLSWRKHEKLGISPYSNPVIYEKCTNTMKDRKYCIYVWLYFDISTKDRQYRHNIDRQKNHHFCRSTEKHNRSSRWYYRIYRKDYAPIDLSSRLIWEICLERWRTMKGNSEFIWNHTKMRTFVFWISARLVKENNISMISKKFGSTHPWYDYREYWSPLSMTQRRFHEILNDTYPRRKWIKYCICYPPCCFLSQILESNCRH